MLKTWFSFLRLPNVFTAPGDALAGYFLSGASQACWGHLAGVFLFPMLVYAFGIVTNDLFDMERDRRERPDRPLPSQAISIRSAVWAAVLLLVAAFGLGWRLLPGAGFGWFLALVGAVLAYNAVLKRFRWSCAVSMGVCRGLNLLTGAAMGGGEYPIAVWVGAVTVVLLIAGITVIADYETRGCPPAWSLWLAAGVIPLGWLLAADKTACGPAALAWSFLAMTAAESRVACSTWKLAHRALTIVEKRRHTGYLLQALIPLQCSGILLGNAQQAWWCAGAVALGGLAAKKLARVYPQS